MLRSRILESGSYTARPAVQIPRSDDHLASACAKHLKDAGNVVSGMLAVAIDANYIAEAEFEGELVARLHAAAEAEMMGQRQYVGTGPLCHDRSRVRRSIIDYEHRNSWQNPIHIRDDAGHRAFFVEARDQDQ